MTRQQKIIVISAIILLVGIVGLFLLFSKKQTPTEELPINTVEEDTVTDDFSQTETLTPQKITENPVSVFTYRENTLYFIDEGGGLFKKQVEEEGTSSERIGTFLVQDPGSLAISKKEDLVLIGEGTPKERRKFTLVNTQTSATTQLPLGVQAVLFLNDNELAYYKESLAQTGVFIYTIKTKKERLVASLIPRDIRLSLFDASHLLIVETPTNDVPNFSFLLNLATKKLSPYFTNVLGATIVPIGRERSLAFLQNPINEDGDKPYNLVLLDKKAHVNTIFSILTMPEKCVTNSSITYLYCAVPLEWTKVMPNLDLPDDYYTQRTDFTEKFYRINLITSTADELTLNAALE
ncbi:MAG: hypothetical protein AAB611_00480, partial [Patescibacteria group bacterium]